MQLRWLDSCDTLPKYRLKGGTFTCHADYAGCLKRQRSLCFASALREVGADWLGFWTWLVNIGSGAVGPWIAPLWSSLSLALHPGPRLRLGSGPQGSLWLWPGRPPWRCSLHPKLLEEVDHRLTSMVLPETAIYRCFLVLPRTIRNGESESASITRRWFCQRGEVSLFSTS